MATPGAGTGARKTVAASTALAVAVAGLVAAAVLWDGEAQAEVELNDSGVWVSNASAGLLGRFNTQSQALDGTLLASSSTFELQQDAQQVLMLEPSTASASSVDPVHLALGPAIVAPEHALVVAGGETVAILDRDDGKLWVLPFASAASFDADELDPVLDADGATALAVSRAGTVLVAVPGDDGALYRVPTTSTGTPREPERSGLDAAAGHDLQVSAAGDRAVVLDRTAGTLLLPGGTTVTIDDAAEAQLQQPSLDDDVVLVATPSGLVSAPAGGGDPQVRRASGLPAAPVRLDGCSYGAWSQTGQVLRDCEGSGDDVDKRLDGLGADSRLAYRVNRHAIVLNDLAAGTLWMAASDYELVDDWDQTTPKDAEGEESESDQTTPELVDQLVADRSQPNRPPVANPDDLGVRAGRSTVLDVLRNDSDPDGDVITATVDQAPDAVPVVPVLGGAALQAQVPADAAGVVSFGYTVSDGRAGGTAQSTVQLRVVPPQENDPPVQTGEPVLTVGRGGTATIDVLPYFRDPDGDSIVLDSATTGDAADEVRFRPDGTVTLRDGGGATGRKIVDVTVSDDRGLTVQGRLLVDVVAEQVPPVPGQDHVTVLAGQAVTVEPLLNDTDPNGDPLRLVSVAEQAPATVTPNYATGTFRFVSPEPGSYGLTYQVSDGPSASTGLVRVDVVAPPGAGGDPVAVGDQVLLPAGGRALVDVLANDTDPAGGVLVVQSVQVPPDAGITVAVLAHQVLRVTETRRLTGPVTVTYTVSNGERVATGELRVVPIPEPDRLRPPDAQPDEVTVHTGDVVTARVLANDTHPDGLELALAPELVEQPEEELGEAFVAQDTVRFKAAATAGTAHLVYEVVDPNGQKDAAQVTVRVLGGEENAAPLLPDATARVIAGGTVRITPPLEGSDPDGDLVTVDQIASTASLGTATVVDGLVEYTADATAAGVDTFTYRAVDTRGATAIGTVRVGIARPSGTNQPPVAVDDAVRVRPGRTVAIDAVANDSDPDGDRVGLVPGSVEGGSELDPQVVDGRLVVKVPGDAGVHTMFYGVEDTFAARATGAVTVDVDPEAPLLAPVAHDDVVTSTDVTGAEVTVDVLANDADPDGTAEDLTVTVDDAAKAAGVHVTDAGALVVPLTPRSQVLTYTVTDADGLTARAFVRVPRDGVAPRLRDGLDLRVEQGKDLPLDLADVVVVAAGRTARLVDENEVKAVPGAVQVQDATHLTYTPPADHVGPATLNLEVTDGTSADDVDGRRAVLTVPMTVVAPANLPPVLTGRPVIEVAPGEEATVDVARFASDPDGDPLSVEVTGAVDGLTTTVAGTRVTAQADVALPKGSQLQVPVRISDGVTAPVDAQVGVTVVASTRPLVVANDDTVDDAHQGKAVTVPVLANDANPFPGKDLTLLSAAVETGVGTVRTEGDKVVVTPDQDFVGRMVVRYRVQDATKDPDREVEGRVQLTVLGRPEAPRAPVVEEVRSKTVVLSWEPPVDNGSPITGYTLTSSKGDTRECAATTCTIDGLTNDVTYTFTVTATNDVGTSSSSPASAEARPDEAPDAPAPPVLAFGDKSLTITWVNKTYTDRSAIQCVDLEISPAPASGAVQKPCVTGTSTTWTGLENGTGYTVRVRAKNAAPDPSEWSAESAPMVPAAPPAAPATPTATNANTSLGGQVKVTWVAPATNGDAIKGYQVTAYDGSTVAAQTPAVGTSGAVLGTATTYTFTGLQDLKSYTFTVTATNKAGTSPASPRSAAVPAYGTPDKVAGASAKIVAGSTSGQATVSWPGLSAAAFHGTGGYYKVRVAGTTATRNASDTSFVWTGLTNGTAYTFEVVACNDNICSTAWTATPTAVTPYTTPTAPGLAYGRTGTTTGRFTTSAPSSDGGSTLRSYEWDVNGAVSSGGVGGSLDVGTGYDQTFKVRVRAVNDAGPGPWSGYVTGKTDPNPNDMQVSITRGGSQDANRNCFRPGTGTCWDITVHVSNAQPNATVYWGCWTTEHWDSAVPPGMNADSRQFEPAWSGYNAGETTNASGAVSFTPCMGLSGNEDYWVVVRKFDGTQNSISSNRLRW
ncbi:fibronectin type III domain-containing protein [Xylanimonas protaetiae]|uniref:Fibronectin type III domain-containing protein n=1 Tax=Xylanimonas protaetiae TaxID=2509457 RepID=A0A4P6F9B8_9MICO|nr:fibronectin type III domain-containing protein [Xylanimonas protaetiae]QAY69947.1 fibronectin type III domain-containing protein [Xylanimonas protaetiae]